MFDAIPLSYVCAEISSLNLCLVFFFSFYVVFSLPEVLTFCVIEFISILSLSSFFEGEKREEA